MGVAAGRGALLSRPPTCPKTTRRGRRRRPSRRRRLCCCCYTVAGQDKADRAEARHSKRASRAKAEHSRQGSRAKSGSQGPSRASRAPLGALWGALAPQSPPAKPHWAPWSAHGLPLGHPGLARSPCSKHLKSDGHFPAKTAKSDGVLLQNEPLGTHPRNPRNPRNPRKWSKPGRSGPGFYTRREQR